MATKKSSSNWSNDSLTKFLLTHSYHRVKLRKLSTGHLVLRASLNKVDGLFILDSGAGATVIDEAQKKLFRLKLIKENNIGAGAGGSGLTVYRSDRNKIKLGNFSLAPFSLAVMDLSHATMGLKQHGVRRTIHGVIGADVLESGKALIDYAGKYLYLR